MISKALFSLSALISAGLVSAYEVPESPATSPNAVVAARFPTAEERFARPDQLMLSPAAMLRSIPDNLAPTAAPKRDKLPTPPAACDRQHWPYISAQCLISTDAGSLNRQVRIITIERRYGENTSMLAAVEPARMAGR